MSLFNLESIKGDSSLSPPQEKKGDGILVKIPSGMHLNCRECTELLSLVVFVGCWVFLV